MPSDPILEGLFKTKIAGFRSTSDCDGASHDQEVARNHWTPNYQQLKTAVKLHIDQMMRNHNFKVGNDVVERGFSHQESKKETKPLLRGKLERVFSEKHTDNVPKETHVVSLMTL